jgi:MFS superfamily sulfate permease-like transporter
VVVVVVAAVAVAVALAVAVAVAAAAATTTTTTKKTSYPRSVKPSTNYHAEIRDTSQSKHELIISFRLQMSCSFQRHVKTVKNV